MPTATASPSSPAANQAPRVPVRRFSVNEYHRMIQHGVLTADDRVELLEGLIVPKIRQNPPHFITVQKSQDRINDALPAGWPVRPQGPITTDDSEPEPDLAVVRGSRDDYKSQHPRPPDTGVVAEVADNTLGDDRDVKEPIYAAAGIPVFWIINLIEEQIEVYEDPNGTGPSPTYRRKQTYRRGEEVPLVLNGKEVARIAVNDLLP